ncbi:hypothetical protein [Photobacterium damselae]|uniref:hypothetical protein n=1 Tax=Photobacterium damselae TaxID=38293 RepID=UPI00406761AF
MSIAKLAHEESNKVGRLVIPDGVTGKITTIKTTNGSISTAVVFDDGSELTIGSDQVFFTEPDEWMRENITPPKAKG